MMSQDKILSDGKLHVYLVGSGGPMSNKVRVSSGIAIAAGGEFILVDVGSGSFRNAEILRLPVEHLSAIFLTHFHSDHICDLGEANMLTWANGRSKPIEVFGPEGVDKVVNGFIMAYELDVGYRIAHHGEDIMSVEASKPISKTVLLDDKNERKLCFDRNGLKVFAFEVDHSPVAPAYGYRIEYGGNVVVITGDTIKTDNVIKHSQGADILFCEAISYEMVKNIVIGAERLKLDRYVKILNDIQDYHMEPVAAAAIAKEARVKKLVIVHVTPPLPSEKMEEMYLTGVSDIYDGPVVLGKDLMKFRLNQKK